MDQEQNSLIGLAPLATRLGLPMRWIRQEAEAKRLPHVKAGRRLLFNPDAVEHVLAERAARENLGEDSR